MGPLHCTPLPLSLTGSQVTLLINDTLSIALPLYTLYMVLGEGIDNTWSWFGQSAPMRGMAPLPVPVLGARRRTCLVTAKSAGIITDPASGAFPIPGSAFACILFKEGSGSASSVPLCSGEEEPEFRPQGLPRARFSPAGAPLVALVLRAMP